MRRLPSHLKPLFDLRDNTLASSEEYLNLNVIGDSFKTGEVPLYISNNFALDFYSLKNFLYWKLGKTSPRYGIITSSGFLDAFLLPYPVNSFHFCRLSFKSKKEEYAIFISKGAVLDEAGNFLFLITMNKDLLIKKHELLIQNSFRNEILKDYLLENGEPSDFKIYLANEFVEQPYKKFYNQLRDSLIKPCADLGVPVVSLLSTEIDKVVFNNQFIEDMSFKDINQCENFLSIEIQQYLENDNSDFIINF